MHLIKLAVGAESVDSLAEWQRRRLEVMRANGEPPILRHVTRHTPRRAAELLDGGSLYWVIRGVIRVRQRLTAIEPFGDDGRTRCALILDPSLVRTVNRLHRAFQGWRYLKPEDAPPDSDGTGADDVLPPTLAGELRDLGLL